MKGRLAKDRSPVTYRKWPVAAGHFRYIGIFLAFFIFMSLGSDTFMAEAVTAGSIEVHGLHAIESTEMLDMLGIREGETLDSGSIRAGIKRAFLKGVFENISVDVSDHEPAHVIVFVKEKDFIRKILIEGDFQVSKKLIRELFLMKEGQVMRHDLAVQATKDLKEKLLFYGFPHATVGLETDQASAPYRVNLILNVHTGEPLLIKEIHISGDGQDMKGSLNISPGDIYNQKKINDELKRLRERLKKKGYYSLTVGPYSYQGGLLELRMHAGRHLDVIFEGNSSLTTKRLLGEVAFFENELFNNEMVDEAVSKMISLYHAEGHPFAQIAPVINEDSGDIGVTFFVFEGNRIKTRNIGFEGITLPAGTLKNVIALKEGELYNPDLVEKDRESLREFYAALGYLDADIKDTRVILDKEKESADILATVVEGTRTLISSVEIKGAGPDLRSRLEAVLSIKAGDPYNEVDISDARFRILDFCEGYGYTGIDVFIERNIEEHKATIRFVVVGGKKTTIGKTVVTGNTTTRYEAIKREISLGEGKPYSYRTLIRERQKLYKMGLFTNVEVEPVDASSDVKDVLIRVEEGNAGGVEFGFGIADYEKFRAFVEMNYRNLWGMNRQGLIRADASSLQQRTFLQYYDPWFLGYTLPFRAIILYENKKEITIPGGDVRYKLKRYSASAGVERKLMDKIKLELFYEFSVNQTSDVSPAVVLSKEDVGTVAISGVKPSLIYDSRDNPFDPSKGVVAGMAVKWASPVFFSESNFLKVTAFGSLFHRLNKRMVAAVTTNMGIAYGLGNTTDLPLVERFFLGGRSSVRGYAQDTLGPKGSNGDPIGGNAFFMAGLELRTLVGWGFSIVPFVDCGNVWIDAKNFTLGDLKYTTGIGLRYSTPVGPLRVDYGYKLNKGKGESSGELHFSLGHAF